jgi:hypothetical protein
MLGDTESNHRSGGAGGHALQWWCLSGVWNASARAFVQRACVVIVASFCIVQQRGHKGRSSLCSEAGFFRWEPCRNECRRRRSQCRRTHVVFAASADPTTLFLSDTLVRPGRTVRLAASGSPCFTVEMTRGCRHSYSSLHTSNGHGGSRADVWACGRAVGWSCGAVHVLLGELVCTITLTQRHECRPRGELIRPSSPKSHCGRLSVSERGRGTARCQRSRVSTAASRRRQSTCDAPLRSAAAGGAFVSSRLPS